jgi:hypothetical protein
MPSKQQATLQYQTETPLQKQNKWTRTLKKTQERPNQSTCVLRGLGMGLSSSYIYSVALNMLDSDSAHKHSEGKHLENFIHYQMDI